MTSRYLVSIAVLLPFVNAQDQIVAVPVEPKECSVTLGPNDTLPISSAAALISAATGLAPDPATHYMIHVARLDRSKEVIKTQSWYSFHQPSRGNALRQISEGGWNADHFNSLRLFGARKVALVYLHLTEGVTTATARTTWTQGGKRADQLSADAVAGVMNAFDGKNDALTIVDASGRELKTWHGFYLAPAQRITDYKVAITKKIPAPLSNLAEVLALPRAQGAEDPIVIALAPLSLCGAKTFPVDHVPSDMVVSALHIQENKPVVELTKNTYDNEGRYRYDFSLALPLRSYKDLTIDQTNNSLAAKSIERQKLYAMFNFSPFAPYDTKKPHLQLLPVLMVGLPIAGRPLQHPIVAAGMGFNKVQFFVGTQFNYQRTLAAAGAIPPASTATVTGSGAVQERWTSRMVFGINLTVSAVKQALSAAKK